MEAEREEHVGHHGGHHGGVPGPGEEGHHPQHRQKQPRVRQPGQETQAGFPRRCQEIQRVHHKIQSFAHYCWESIHPQSGNISLI